MTGLRPTLALLLLLSACAEDSPTALEPLPPDTMDGRGGTLEFDGGNLRMAIPAGALDQAVTFTVTRTDDALDGGLHGPQYRLGPDGVEFATPAEVRVAFDPADLVGLAEPRHMFAAVKVGDEWQANPFSGVDLATHEVVLPVHRIGPPRTVEVDTPDPAKASVVVWVGPRGGVDANDISLKRPRYVDAGRPKKSTNIPFRPAS